ncbi:hypothetical protein ACOME3_005486 [Neoechinorhynchus agilis]
MSGKIQEKKDESVPNSVKVNSELYEQLKSRAKDSVLEDKRFADLFENDDFQFDPNEVSEHYKRMINKGKMVSTGSIEKKIERTEAFVDMVSDDIEDSHIHIDFDIMTENDSDSEQDKPFVDRMKKLAVDGDCMDEQQSDGGNVVITFEPQVIKKRKSKNVESKAERKERKKLFRSAASIMKPIKKRDD